MSLSMLDCVNLSVRVYLLQFNCGVAFDIDMDRVDWMSTQSKSYDRWIMEGSNDLYQSNFEVFSSFKQNLHFKYYLRVYCSFSFDPKK